jgi:hypothetical protein
MFVPHFPSLKSVTQGSLSLRFAAHFPHQKDPVHMLNLRHSFISFVPS